MSLAKCACWAWQFLSLLWESPCNRIHLSNYELLTSLLQEGTRVLWRGTKEGMLMSIPLVSIYLPLYDMMMLKLERMGHYGPVIAGAVSRGISLLCIAPLEILRMRVQVRRMVIPFVHRFNAAYIVVQFTVRLFCYTFVFLTLEHKYEHEESLCSDDFCSWLYTIVSSCPGCIRSVNARRGWRFNGSCIWLAEVWLGTRQGFCWSHKSSVERFRGHGRLAFILRILAGVRTLYA